MGAQRRATIELAMGDLVKIDGQCYEAAMREIEAALDRPARRRPELAALFARSRPE